MKVTAHAEGSSRVDEHIREASKDLTNNKNRFMSWRDLIITPIVQSIIIILSLLLTWQCSQIIQISLFAMTVIFCFSLFTLTVCVLNIIKSLVRFSPGIFTYDLHPWDCYFFNLYAYLGITNLHLFYVNGLISPVLKKVFYAFLGAKFGKGIIPIGGIIFDPYMVTIEENAFIGVETLLLPHLLTLPNVLILGKITVKKGALIGARSLILPGVTIGENALVNAGSVVPMGTTIGDNEVWGGNPVKKLKDLDPAGPQTHAAPYREGGISVC